ncbi:MAG TPA: SDR family oxidoreductase [Pilimelia sp.]|nr:SDR family oxidoreductase [Pilimelia sp.]
MLTNRTGLIFAATGAIAAAVARRAAAQGARVYLSARDKSRLDAIAAEVTAAGGTAVVDVVDATDPDAVRTYVDRVADTAGRIDFVFNGIGLRCAAAGYATPSTSLDPALFRQPLDVICGSTFLTAREAARHMTRQGGGAVVTLSASLSGSFVPHMAGITAACGAIEALTRTLAAEYGPHGVRVNCVRAAGMPETRTIQETSARMLATLGLDPATTPPPGLTGNALGRPVTVAETAATACYLASDAASGVTGQIVNVCAGQLV